ncbi:hypothetical protein FA951_14185 [Dermacoccus nishinomiyaensis]|uniref:hypothetical protein n=1 Tax=Dermacoccus TaxID=57495 RepID=UPI000317CA61|nr:MULTISPECIES: hypothetical protein [Dermacoccus]MBO1758972.1 hypothetical protein [Dermacoccus sp. NHGro5]TCJ90298.1 hypothetical protein EDC82_0002 [Dermacoccus sp. SAI-028]TJZ94669.1 hypothetical protein FA951_14185 [Dermacoccus nishinomiyaensis]
MAERTFVTATGPDQHGRWGTMNDQPITDGEDGFPGATLNSVGRPHTVGTKRAETVTACLDAVCRRVHDEHTSASAIMRRALDDYLAG